MALIGLMMVLVAPVAGAQNETHDSGPPEPDLGRQRTEPRREAPELHTLNDIYAAVRRCYQPPSPDKALPGMRITVQFAYTREGQLFGKPKILYETPNASPEHQSAYRMAVAAALARCASLNFSKSLGEAVAGRILAMQFVDERNLRRAEYRPWPRPMTP
jgi:hypothetical protein